LHIKAKKYAVHLSDEPMRCPFPMNCLFSTCRLTLIPGGWSATRKFITEVIAEVRTSLNISDFRQMTSKIKSGK